MTRKFQRWEVNIEKFKRWKVNIERTKQYLLDILSTSKDLTQKKSAETALATYDTLIEEFGDMCDMKIIQRWTFFCICMNKKGVPDRGVSQIETTVTKDFKFNIHLNDYKHHEDFYYHGDHLTTNELMAETRSFKAFLHGQGMSENSKLTKEVYFNPEDY